MGCVQAWQVELANLKKKAIDPTGVSYQVSLPRSFVRSLFFSALDMVGTVKCPGY